MLKETSTEKGCFRGCFIAIGIGAVIGMMVAWYLSSSAVANSASVPGVFGQGVAASMRFVFLVVGALGGSILGGLAGLVWERLTVRREKEIEEF